MPVLTWKQLRLAMGLAIVLVLGSALSLAQSDRALSVDEPTGGVLNADSLAQTYVFSGSIDDVVTLTATNDANLPLVIVISDSKGTILAQSVDTDDGIVAVEGLVLTADGRYYVVVFLAPSAGDVGGNFTLTFERVSPDVPEETPIPTEVPDTDSSAEWSEPEQILFAGGIEVQLAWQGSADMNLQVRDPLGQTLYFDSRTTNNGGTFGFDANGLCEVISQSPVETATWAPGFLATGSYEILVFYRQACDTANPVTFTVNVSVNGENVGSYEGTLLPPPQANQDSVFLSHFEVDADGNAVVTSGGSYTTLSINSLPDSLANLSANATSIISGDAVSGVLTNESPYVAYSFEGVADQILTINMDATTGNLDTLLQVVDSNGNLIDVNDDSSGTTNSAIVNLQLVRNDTYTIVATRYGKEIGGTEGNYVLTISGASTDFAAETLNLNLPDGDIEVTLVWNNNADLQLLVRDPIGDVVYDDSPFINSGGILQEDGNVNCIFDDTSGPLSYIYWPNGFQRPGTYEVEVWYQNNCNDPTPVNFTLTIVVNDQVVFVDRQAPLVNQRYVTNFTIEPSGTARAGLGGFIGGSETLNYQSELPSALQLISGQPVSGLITPDNTFDVYTFEGSVGDNISINMAASSQTLDTNVFLISPSGLPVADNDDGDPLLLGTTGRTTDSLISNVTLAEEGQYVVLATRFGTIYGGTVGGYTLTLREN